MIAAVDGAGERLIYTKNGRHVTKSSELEGVEWATISGVVGEQVDGVFPKYSQERVNFAFLMTFIDIKIPRNFNENISKR